MIRYRLAALGLKGFSYNETTRNLYRDLGNWLGAKKRAEEQVPGYYFERVERNVAWCKKYRPLQRQDLVLELGTGWVHWDALTLRLFFDFRAVLYDVWDNRQFDALQSFLEQLEPRLDSGKFGEPKEVQRARGLIKEIQATKTFEEMYELLGFRYVLDPPGLMECLPKDSFDLAVSGGVLEHISEHTAAQFIENMAARLAPGGVGIHGINIGDHLAYYDSRANAKQYLSYSDSEWRRWYENDVQYINRIQRSQWMKMFESTGLAVLEERSARTKLDGLRVDSCYKQLCQEDLECTNLVLVVQKAEAQRAKRVAASGLA